MAAWYFGPFFRLLNIRPLETIALINRMLDHAAAVRVGHHDPWQSPQAPNSPLPGLDLDLPSAGTCHCVGDNHVWYWYRGSSVGPYPCMSALLAVERFADHLVDTLGLPLGQVIEMLLRDCNNLAMPGLVVGLLVRHLERVGNLLDPWLTRPEVWRLEFARAVVEGQLHVQGPDAPDLVGRDRRAFSLRDAAAHMTLRAMVNGDQGRLAGLAAVADELVRRARSLLAGNPGGSEELAAVEGWAASLRPESYHAEPKALDAIAQLARCASPTWQAATGLALAEDAIDGHYNALAGRCWFLTDWLEAVRASGLLQPDWRARWRRLVDGLAAEGDARAVELQQAEE